MYRKFVIMKSFAVVKGGPSYIYGDFSRMILSRFLKCSSQNRGVALLLGSEDKTMACFLK